MDKDTHPEKLLRDKQDGIEEPDTLHASQVPAPPDRMLCLRCEGLQPSKLLERPETRLEIAEAGTSCITIISQQSIDNDCSLCCQLDQLFRPAIAPLDASRRSSPEFELWACQAKDDPMMYFSIIYPSSDQKMFLLQTSAQIEPKSDSSSKTPREVLSTTQREDLLPSALLQDSHFRAIKSWIAQCGQAHPLACSPRLNSTKPRTLIDCVMRILSCYTNQKYVCLSYVWGTDEVDCQTGGNELPQDLPQTISDAMHVTVEVGLRYLWVDRYCIDNSDLKAKHDAIRNMDAICKSGPRTSRLIGAA
jgi:hypothetical protein